METITKRVYTLVVEPCGGRFVSEKIPLKSTPIRIVHNNNTANNSEEKKLKITPVKKTNKTQ